MGKKLIFLQNNYSFACSVDAQIATKDNISLGYGFVTMKTKELAEYAKKKLNNVILEGNKIQVEIAYRLPIPQLKTDKHGRFGEAFNPLSLGRNVIEGAFASHISNKTAYKTTFTITRRKDKKESLKYISTASCKQKMDLKKASNPYFFQSKQHQNFNTLNNIKEEKADYSSSSDSHSFVTKPKISSEKITQLNSYQIKLNSLSEKPILSPTRVYIKNVPYFLTLEKFSKYFEEFNVIDVILERNPYKKYINVGYGFIEFETHKEQENFLKNYSFIKILNTDCLIFPAYLNKPYPEISEETRSKFFDKGIYIE